MSLKIGRLPDVPLDALSFANYHKGVREELLIDSRNYSGAVLNEAKDKNGDVITDTNGDAIYVSGLIYKGDGNDADENVRAVVAQFTLNEYIDFLFLNTLQRKASVEELAALTAIYDTRNYLTTDINGVQIIKLSTSNTNHDDVAVVTFDYISRLPEFYYFKAIN